MSALSDIQREIDRTFALVEAEIGQKLSPAQKRFARDQRLRIKVGPSAARSILAVTGDPDLPSSIDDIPLVRTEEFDGFAVEIL